MTTTATNTEKKNRVKKAVKGASRKLECKKYAELCLARLNSIGVDWELVENTDQGVWYSWTLRYIDEFNYLSAQKLANIHNLMEMVHGNAYITTYDREERNDEGLCIVLEFSKDVTDF